MKQYFTHYENWEDYKNGMYCKTIDRDETQISKAKEILANPQIFKLVLLDLIEEWPISTKVNLTNQSINQRAWLGAAACCFKYGVTEINTRYAWNELNEIQKFEANTVAESIIIHYINKKNNAQTSITF